MDAKSLVATSTHQGSRIGIAGGFLRSQRLVGGKGMQEVTHC